MVRLAKRVCNYLMLAVLPFSFFWLGLATYSYGQSGTSSPAQPSLPKDPTLLLKLLVQDNGLDTTGAQAWHIKLAYDHFDSDGDNDSSGSYEEFFANPRKYKRIYESDNFTQTAFATERGLYLSGSQKWPGLVETQVREEVIEPLYRSSVLPGNSKLERLEWSVGTTKLLCVAARRTDAILPYGFPKYCFGPDVPAVRYTQGRGADETTYNKLSAFGGRYVAGDVKITHAGKPYLNIRVAVLEAIPDIKDADFFPTAGAVVVGDRIEVPSAELSDYLVKEPTIDYRGSVRGNGTVELLIGKDGHVTSAMGIEGPPALQKAAAASFRKIEIRPFLVLGQPVQVKTTWHFEVH